MPLGFVCIINNLYLYKYFEILSYALNVLHSLRKMRNLLLFGSRFFTFKSGTLCFFRVSLSFRCIGHHSQRGGGRDFACRSTRGAQRCAGGLWPGVTWRFRKVKFLWRILKSLRHSMQVETRRVVHAEILNRNFEFARKLKANILVYVARYYVGYNFQDPCCQTRAFSDLLFSRPQVEVIGDGAELPLVHANTFATGSSLCKSNLNQDFNHFTHVAWYISISLPIAQDMGSDRLRTNVTKVRHKFGLAVPIWIW